MNKLRTRAIFFAILICSALTTIFNKNAIAVDTPEYRLQISPTQVDLRELEPGKTYNGSFKVQNTGSLPYNFEVTVQPYSVSGEQYEASFINQNTYTQMREWVTTSIESGTVEPGVSQEVQFSITVPDNAPAGNQNAAIVVAMLNEDELDNSGVKTIQQAAFIMFSNVKGETRIGGAILENKIPGFIFEPPITATSVVENTGNIYTVAKYTLEVRELFGDKLVYTNAEEANGEIIFPETERYNEVSWENAPQLGIFKVKQTIKIFDEESVVEKLVFLCPIWFLCVIIAFVAILVFMIVSRILKRRAV